MNVTNSFNKLFFILIPIIPIISCTSCTRQTQTEEKLPQVFLFNPYDLFQIKQQISSGNSSLLPAYKKLLNDADQALQVGPFSVMDKPFTPPSGDRHDYMSLAPYWWPNPDTENGLPYIRKDGVVNPERDQYDRNPLRNLGINVTTLALAYYFSDHEPYAVQAAKLIKTWFLDEKTRMNPLLKYAQAVPGVTEGRGTGIIDTRAFFLIADAIGLIAHSNSWTENDQAGMKKWFNDYLVWLLNSDHGKYEASRKNNHGTWYDVIAGHLALFVDNQAVAKDILGHVPVKRIAVQIEPDGSQPEELTRTRAFHYSAMSLQGLFYTALLGEHVGLDLWDFYTEDGRSLKAALEYLIPFALQEKKWPFQMIHGWEDDFEIMFFLLRVAAQKYQHPEYEKLIEKLPDIDVKTHRLNLVYPGK
jgi:hypothetical protein